VNRFLLSFVIVLLSATPGTDAYAKLSGGEAEHARSAVNFAERRDWDDALSHAKSTSEPAMVKLITWQYMLDNDSGASFEEIVRFIENNPHWPEQKKLRIRAEQSLKSNTAPDADIIDWFGDKEPITGIGKVALAEAMKRKGHGSQDKIATLIREAWHNGDFDEPQEKKLLEDYDNLLTRDDHVKRIDRLLWEERTGPAKRVLKYVPDGHQKLFKARMALIDDKRLSIVAVTQVPAALKDDPGLTFDRMRYRARRDDNKGAREMLLKAPASPPYPEKWWKYREVQIREAIGEKDFDMASRLLANHGQADGASLADALWLKGWMETEYLGSPKQGYEQFYDMFGKVRYPVSKARAAYWAGRAAEKSGDAHSADNWYSTAASFPTTFYGQLGSLKRNGTAPLHVPSSPSVSSEAKRKFDNNDFADAIRLCIEAGGADFARRMITLAVENSDNSAEVTLFAELGNKAGREHLSVRAAKRALQQNIVLVDAGYPKPETPSEMSIERALTLAITRQESEFDPNARSSANALGLMQLLPGTAKEVAKKNSMTFSKDRLSDPQYNMTLGSLYLARLISSYDGSYIMAIAAYNAGPGNVRRWVREFGTPGNDTDNAINWIEKIPFYETRNYVQRVLENLQVYRNLEGDGSSQKLALAEDLAR